MAKHSKTTVPRATETESAPKMTHITVGLRTIPIEEASPELVKATRELQRVQSKPMPRGAYGGMRV